MATSTDDFSIWIAEQPDEMKTAIEMLDKIEADIKQLKITSQEIFDKACELKSTLSSLSCYTFNNNPA